MKQVDKKTTPHFGIKKAFKNIFHRQAKTDEFIQRSPYKQTLLSVAEMDDIMNKVTEDVLISAELRHLEVI